jgi:hypothetical protein
MRERELLLCVCCCVAVLVGWRVEGMRNNFKRLANLRLGRKAPALAAQWRALKH